jgi:hypothetical protein
VLFRAQYEGDLGAPHQKKNIKNCIYAPFFRPVRGVVAYFANPTLHTFGRGFRDGWRDLFGLLDLSRS